MSFPISKHRLWQVAVDAGLIAAAWYLAFQLRFDNGIPIYYDTLFARSIAIVIGIQLVTFVALRLLQPLVALRVHPGHVGAARGVTVACVISSLVALLREPRAERRACRASIAIMDFLLLLAFVAGSRMLARTLIERPRRARHRRPRQGGRSSSAPATRAT